MATMQFGRSYEEFEVGAVYKHWPGKTVTEYDDHLFCLLTMNHHPLHLDANYAGTTQFGQNVVVGNYVYSLLLGMSVPDVSGKAIANLEIESLRHVAPTFHGDTIYGETTVLDKWESTSKDDRGVVHVETKGYKQDGTLVCIFKRKVMVPEEQLPRSARRRAARPSDLGGASSNELKRILRYGGWPPSRADRQLCFWVTSIRPWLPSALVHVTALIESLPGSVALVLATLRAKITLPSPRRFDTMIGRNGVRRQDHTDS